MNIRNTYLVSLSMLAACNFNGTGLGSSSGQDSATAGESESSTTDVATPTTSGSDATDTDGGPTTSSSGSSTTQGSEDSDSTTEGESSSSTSGDGVKCDPANPASSECQQLDPSQPYCIAVDVCGSCEDLHDAGTDCNEITNGALPACSPELGSCVECTAENDLACGVGQVCNSYINDCDVCFEHAQCASGACNIESGICFPEKNVYWVERRNFCNDQDGSEEKPYCHLFDAINDNFLKGDLTLMLKSGIGPQGEYQTVITNGIKVAIIGVGDKTPIISNPSSKDPAVIVDSNSSLYISNVDIVDNKSTPVAIKCTGSTLHLDNLRLAGNVTPVDSTSCDMTINRVLWTQNTEGALITGATTKIVNSLITENEIQNFGTPIRVNANIEVLYSTIVANDATQSTAFSCLANNDVSVRNSVLIGQPDPVALCNLTENEDESGSYISGKMSDIGQLFQEPTGGVYRPQTDAEAIKNITSWDKEDPYIDFEGKLRPHGQGLTDFAGALRP